jgi:hypothetical protein
LIDKAEPPEASRRDAHWSKLIAASALRGAIFSTTKEALDHGSRRLFLRLTGSWPG